MWDREKFRMRSLAAGSQRQQRWANCGEVTIHQGQTCFSSKAFWEHKKLLSFGVKGVATNWDPRVLLNSLD